MRLMIFLAALAVCPPLSAQARSGTPPVRKSDSAFAALQERGHHAMGVDQYASRHRFESLSDGGRIELLLPGGDSASISRIRTHMRGIAAAFKNGDFSTPAFVHMHAVPGTPDMSAKRDAIEYEARDLPTGAELRMRTSDSLALRAIHQFMEFQRSDHRVPPETPRHPLH